MVKNSASPKRPFVCVCVCVCVFRAIFSIFRAFQSKSWANIHFFYTYCTSFISLQPHPPLIQKWGGGMLYIMHIHFPIGTRPHLAQKGGHVPEMPSPPRSTYASGVCAAADPAEAEKVLFYSATRKFGKS